MNIKRHYYSIASGLCGSLASFFGKMINFSLFGNDVSIKEVLEFLFINSVLRLNLKHF